METCLCSESRLDFGVRIKRVYILDLDYMWGEDGSVSMF